MKLQSLYIKNFRHINDVNIEFGNKLTVFAGQNGTGKSSLLGWIAQLCDSKLKSVALNNNSFKEDYSKVFRFCKHNDYKNSYEVKFIYDDHDKNTKTKTITTRYVKKTNKSPERYRTDFDGRGNALDYPVIYLGLRRLIPIATEDDVIIVPNEFKKQYNKLFSELSKHILILIDENISPETITSTNKDTLAIKTDDYSHLGNSAGQDNLGQIISSLISYQKLKDELKDDYEGGIILIDEVDATLFAGSQLKLIDYLIIYAKTLNLQIIFTTHSLEILEHLNSNYIEDTKINYLHAPDRMVTNLINPSFEYISNKIKVLTNTPKLIQKKLIVCEDKFSEAWGRNLLNGSDLKSMFEINKGPFPDGQIISMANSKNVLFKNVGFLLDGDARNKKDAKNLKNTIFLPGSKPPEMIIYEYFRSLSNSDDFWIDELNFTKQTCFKDYPRKTQFKNWINDETLRSYFGRGYSKLFNTWKKGNKTIVKQFQEELRKL